MRHIYIRSFIALIWLAAAIYCGISGNLEMTGLYLILGGVFLFSARTMWKKKKEQDKGDGIARESIY